MEAKAYLDQIRLLDLEIKALKKREAETAQTMADIKGLSYDGIKVKSSSNAGRIPDMVARLDSIRSKIRKKRVALEEAKAKIQSQIFEINRPTLIDLLEKRYVQLMNFEKIAAEMNYSYDHILRLHKMALEAFGRCHGMSV